MKLDFPQAPEIKAKVPNPARNEELKVKYNITGFPTVMLMTPEGEVYASTGNNGTGPEEYAQHVMDLRTKGKPALDAAKAIESEFANAKDKVAIVKKAIAALNALGAGAGPGEIYARVVRQGFALDPENKSGLKLESLKCLLQAEHAAQGEMDLALEMDPKNELGLMEMVVVAEPMSAFGLPDEAARDARLDLFLAHAKTLLDLKKVHDKSKASMAFAYAAFIHNQMRGELEKAKPFAQRALELGGLPEHFIPPMQEIVGLQ